MGLQLRLYLLIGLMFGILYAVILGVSNIIGFGGLAIYAVIAAGFILLQYLIGPALVSALMRVKYVSEKEQPDLHHMVAELASEAGATTTLRLRLLNFPTIFYIAFRFS